MTLLLSVIVVSLTSAGPERRSRAREDSADEFGGPTPDPRDGGDHAHLICDRLTDSTLAVEERTLLQTRCDLLDYGRGSAREYGRYLQCFFLFLISMFISTADKLCYYQSLLMACLLLSVASASAL